MKKKNTIRCPYCGANAKLRPANVVYGEMTLDNHAYVYVCDRYPACDAYVSAHAESKLPLGTLANGDLRNKRIRAHRAFDQLWKSGRMTKKKHTAGCRCSSVCRENRHTLRCLENICASAWFANVHRWQKRWWLPFEFETAWNFRNRQTLHLRLEQKRKICYTYV